MRQLIAILALCSLAFGCAASATNTRSADRTNKRYYMVVRAPRSVLGSDADPSQFRVYLHMVTWLDNATGVDQSYATYCDLHDDYLECLAPVPVEFAYLEFELKSVWFQPNPATLTPEQKAVLEAALEDQAKFEAFKKIMEPKICDTVIVGVSVGHFWVGGNSTPADRWMEIAAKREPFCRYQVPRDFVVGSRK